MVKREKSPEVIEDVRLFVVWIPYPLNPNWVYEQDVQGCAKWVAEVIGNEYYLISIHQKPSSRGMILLEISKEFTNHGRLLGEHQWCNFLKDATEEENGHNTCVYYSIYRTCREARKDGWNPISIPTKWLKAWSPGIGRFVSPYPEPRHCPLPPEDRTSKQICRHIPLSTKPALTKPLTKANSPPIVGSSAWTAQQKEVPNIENAGNWRTQGRANSATTANFVAIPSPLRAPIGDMFVLPQSSERSLVVLPSKKLKSKSKAVPLQKMMSQPQVPQKWVQAPAWVGRSVSSPSNSTGQKPPATGEPPAKPQSAWEKPLKIVPLKPAKVTIHPDSTKSWQSSHESWADIMEDEMTLEGSDIRPDEFTSPRATHLLTPIHENLNLKGMNSLNESESSPIPSSTTFQHSDSDECDLEVILAPMGNSSLSSIPPSTDSSKDPSTQPSDDKDWSKAWSDAEEKVEKKILCPTHGPACSKKICQDYQKLEKERKREEAKKTGQWRGRGRGRGFGRWPFKAGD